MGIQLNLFKERKKKWEDGLNSSSNRAFNFNTLSNEVLDTCYFPKDPNSKYLEKDGFPGQFPFTRGIHANLYRGKLWTMRQFAGFGKPEETNDRFKKLLDKGQTGLSVAYDMPTLMGYDPDHEFSDGEVGKCGVSVSTLNDMIQLFDGIDLGKVSVSQTINGPAIILLAFYIAAAEKQGVSKEKLNGTLQNDILKEFIAQKEWIFPPRASMRIVTDMLSYCTKYMPKYNTISVSGYHIREAGSTAAQELAFTLANGFSYIEHGIQSGLKIDDFAPRLSFFFNSHLDFFEEIAKFRAARRIWAKKLKYHFKAKTEASYKLRFHTQTAGCSLTAQQPEINIARTGFQALAGVLGGTQSLHTNSMDETLSLPTEKAAEIALRTQQLLAYETGVASVVDPLGGSYFIEELTDKIEKKAEEYFKEIDTMGGVIIGIEDGYFQREIARSASEYQLKVDDRERIVVGVNKFINENEKVEIPTLDVGLESGIDQVKKIKALKESRDNTKVHYSIEKIKKFCNSKQNLVPVIIDAAKNDVTMGEIVEAMKSEFGEWSESSVF
jgi:methylmalonyl-CoA mutase, N-terminal domain